MTVELRFQQLLVHRSCWQQDAHDPEAAYGLLSCIGYLRRAGILAEQLAQLRALEVEVRKRWQPTLEALGKFMAQSTLLQQAVQLTATPDDEDMQLSFYQDRDDAQLAWQVAQEYTDDEAPANYPIIGQIRSQLEAVDDIVLFHADVVAGLRRIGELEPVAYADRDLFWWLPCAHGDCHLPAHRRDDYMAQYADGCLPGETKTAWARHLMSCQDCRERWQMLKQDLPAEATSKQDLSRKLADVLQFRPQLAAAAKEGDNPLQCFYWQDASETWEVCVYLENSKDSSDDQPIFWRLCNTREPVTDWPALRLHFGTLAMTISAEAYACCKRIEMQQMQQQGAVDCRLFRQADALTVTLDFRGEKNG